MGPEAAQGGPHESEIGLGALVTSSPGLGGRLKTRVEDFVVEETGAAPVAAPGGRFTAARIRLANWETNAFVREASQRLGMSRNRIHFSGTKDKRGLTERWFTFEAPAEAVQTLGTLSGVELVETRPTAKELQLGDHRGNRFRVVLRNVEGTPEKVQAIVDGTWNELEALGGAPNFFGPQRFGSKRPTTHRVGARIIQGDFDGAVRAYLEAPLQFETDAEAGRDWASALDAGQWQGALSMLSGDVAFERALLHRLIETGDPIDALLALPKNLQLLFVYAYQSWLFNQILSRRIEAGLPLHRPTEGDLVAAWEGGEIEDDWVPVSANNLDRVESEISRGRAVLTGLLPGTEAPLASGAMGTIERDVLEKEGRKARDFLVSEHLAWSSRGTRRALVAPVSGFEANASADDLHAGRVKVDFRFELPAGSYATALLREFMKSPRLADYG